MSSLPPAISLVIPAHNEEALLPRLLESVAAARERYAAAGGGAVEVVVADDASTDRTAAIAAAAGCVVAPLEARRIAAARNAGAAASSGAVLAFVDADSRIHPETFAVIARTLASPRFVAGATGVRPERWSAGIAATWALLMPGVWLLRMDAGVVFSRRADFEAIGGYDERRSFGEDVQLLWDLRRLGRSRGQRLARPRGAKTVASVRKFDRFGDWHFIALALRLGPKMLLRPGTRSELVRRYWYGDDR